MKKVLLASLTAIGLISFTACSSDDDDNGSGNGGHPIEGVWNLDVQLISGSGSLDLGLAQIPYDIRNEKVGGSGTWELRGGDMIGNGVIEVETEFTVIFLGDTISDTTMETEDLSDSDSSYELVEGNIIRITQDGETNDFNYNLDGDNLTITGKVTVTEEGPTGQDLEFELDFLMELSR